MVARIIIPEVVNLKDGNIIVQGADNYYEFQVKDVDGTIVDISGVDPTTELFCEFRTHKLGDAGSTTSGCPIPRLYIPASNQGKLWLHLTKIQTNNTPSQILEGFYDIEMIFEGHKCRIFEGAWKHDAKQVTNKYNV